MSDFNGYANQPSLDFEQHTANTYPVYAALRLFAGECLRRVPGMTSQTLGRNITDNARIIVEQANAGEPLRFLGWGDHIKIDQASARHWVELGTVVGLNNWNQISETDVGDSWMEVAEEQAKVRPGCAARAGDALHFDDGTHRTTPPTADGRTLERHEAAIRAHLAEIGA